MRKAIMKTVIGIFRGKAKENNKFLLETLYDKGPLTAWELTREATKYQRIGGGRHSLHATYNKRLRILESQGYVQRVEKKWILQFKGIIAVLFIQDQPKPWNEKWTKIFKNFVQPIMESPKKYAITADGTEIAVFKDYINKALLSLKDLESWVALADKVKNYMERGFINLDVISNETLCILLIKETLFDKKTPFI